jgi:hypothetical protein
VDEALQAKRDGTSRVILFNLYRDAYRYGRESRATSSSTLLRKTRCLPAR